LLIVSDKALLTRIYGDKTVWPVYLLIRNLDNATYRQISRPSAILFSFLLIVPKGTSRDRKYLLYYRGLKKILEPIKKLFYYGIVLRYVDSIYRKYYPIIARFIVNYKEQVLIAGVKNNACPIYIVPSDSVERKNLEGIWPKRLHNHTKAQVIL
ncbi:hypothetical protein K432DRAFT_313418, partial [Lepidopterella palustris CBS 459.81]